MRCCLILVSLLAVFTASEAFAQTGACCSHIYGTCSETDPTTCENQAGAYQGDGTLCSETDCPGLGACCNSATGNCEYTGTQYLCENWIDNGTFLGEGTTCDGANPCPQPTVGACCSIYDGNCSIVSQTTCESGDGIYHGDDSLCENVTCPVAGACCMQSAPSLYGYCLGDKTEYLCSEVWGEIWLGEGTTCNGEENPCPQAPKGACCLPNGVCVDDLLPDICEGGGDYDGVYQGDYTTCDTTSCPQPAIGACCMPSGNCVVTMEYLCEQYYGVFHGDGTDCFPAPCAAEPPPYGWVDNFDSYANGELMYDIGGWYGWNYDLLHAGTITTEQAHSAPNSFKANDLCDAIHPFDPHFEDTTWTITAWQYIPSDLDDTSFLVVNSWYDEDNPSSSRWAVQLEFDPTTNTVTESLRADDGVPNSLPLIYDQWVEIVMNVDFEPDTNGYGGLVITYGGQQLIDSTWHFGTSSTRAIGNIDLYAPHSTPVYYDDLSVVKTPSTSTLPVNPVAPLFAGLDSYDYDTRSTDLSGAPGVTWNSNGFKIEVVGAAGRPDGAVYVAGGNHRSTMCEIFLVPLGGPAMLLSRTDRDFSSLAYGKGKLYGFSNVTPKGIYEIQPIASSLASETTLVLDTGGKLFFGLDYNPVDGLFYGITGSGSPTGLYSIDIDTGEMIHVASPVPSANTAVQGLACGNNKVYAMTVYGDAGYPMYVYDLAQGSGGTWEAMTHPFPEAHTTGGLAWRASVLAGDTNCDGKVNGIDVASFVEAYLDPAGFNLDCMLWNADIDADGDTDADDIEAFVDLMLS